MPFLRSWPSRCELPARSGCRAAILPPRSAHGVRGNDVVDAESTRDEHHACWPRGRDATQDWTRMNTPTWNRRNVGLRLAAAAATLGFARVSAAAPTDSSAAANPADGITHSSASIHQAVTFLAPRNRVYRALTDAAEFDKVVHLSAAAAYAARPGAAPTTIRAEVGGRFQLFGGYITGQQIELVPDTRIVQVWRSGSWEPGEYSIVAFTLQDSGQGSRLLLDHRGFPDDQAEHLAEGWRVNYWQPIKLFLER
jgi:activator of HSP90 ATPase